MEFPGESRFMMGILVAAQLHNGNVSGYLRQLSDDDLRVMAVHIGECEPMTIAFTNAVLEASGAMPTSEPTWWVTDVLPAIKTELDRRTYPVSSRYNSYMDQLKGVDLQTLAGKYTELQYAGPNRLKGRCPLHEERTPSFYIFLDSNRWRCFGACAAGGDVVNLLERLKERDG